MFFPALPGEIGAIILKEHISVFRIHNSKISQTLSSIMEFRMLKPYHCNQGPRYSAYAAASLKTLARRTSSYTWAKIRQGGSLELSTVYISDLRKQILSVRDSLLRKNNH